MQNAEYSSAGTGSVNLVAQCTMTYFSQVLCGSALPYTSGSKNPSGASDEIPDASHGGSGDGRSGSGKLALLKHRHRDQ